MPQLPHNDSPEKPKVNEPAKKNKLGNEVYALKQDAKLLKKDLTPANKENPLDPSLDTIISFSKTF